MKVASSLASGPHPTVDLATAAVRDAMQAAGLERADSILLFLTRDYVRHAQPAIVAAARAAGTLQVTGCTAYGLLTEEGWLLDQSGAAALVIAYATPDDADTRHEPLLSFTGHHTLPHDWQRRPERVGLLDAEAVTWSHGRLAGETGSELLVAGIHARIACSPGLRMLSQPLAVNAVAGYDLCELGGLPAINSLQRSLPAELRAEPPLHQIVVARQPGTPAVPILAANADGSLTLAEALAIDEPVRWAIRQPLSAEQDMRQSLLATVDLEKRPDFALMFSCLGRGPLFYGDDDRDLLAFRETFPGVPLIGAYGSGQIAPAGNGNRLFQNTVVTLLCESAHV
ncbi:MAG: FIST C-terminal domain-containing protein [Dechloromonas sp.]|uniref:FIST C-terminal domain-containing protein n=1 Tax=Candidatus Dechloromonas phosphorivorans TaxID=2899244 RepID=A0A9D7QL79_9RHOO|nr:FIST C-terminal domain-containing protein [Candidatus Dechloromonas phosphorivorans]